MDICHFASLFFFILLGEKENDSPLGGGGGGGGELRQSSLKCGGLKGPLAMFPLPDK